LLKLCILSNGVFLTRHKRCINRGGIVVQFPLWAQENNPNARNIDGVVNLNAYGCAGDGVTDNAACLNAAWNAVPSGVRA
jgi:hypothetical protein